MDIQDFVPIPHKDLNNFMINKLGYIYNKNTNKILKGYYHINVKIHTVNLNGSTYQIKYLLFITFINNDKNLDIYELRNQECIYMINIKKYNDDLDHINFTLDNLELITKSDKLKMQERNNRIINKYDPNLNFIKSYNSVNEIMQELNVKYPKYITLACGKNKNKTYRDHYYRYDDDDNIKNNLFDPDNINGANEETKKETDENKYDDIEIWTQLTGYEEDDEYYNKYEISNRGNFRNKSKQKIAAQSISNGYYYCSINKYNSEKNIKKVDKIKTHILVARYFVEMPEQYKNEINLVVDHIDHNKLNNYYKNLQYLPIGENNKRG